MCRVVGRTSKTVNDGTLNGTMSATMSRSGRSRPMRLCGCITIGGRKRKRKRNRLMQGEEERRSLGQRFKECVRRKKVRPSPTRTRE